jgi:hypothetical protein
MKKVFSIDRIEGNIAVCISDDDLTLHVPTSVLGDMRVRDVFSAVVVGETLTDVVPMPEERDRRIAANRARLHALAKRNKENK